MSNLDTEALKARHDRIWRAFRLYGFAVISIGLFTFGSFDVGKEVWLRTYGIETSATITNVRSQWIKRSYSWFADYTYTSVSGAKVQSAMSISGPATATSTDHSVRQGEYRDRVRGGRITVIYAPGWPRFHIVKADRYVWPFAIAVYFVAFVAGIVSIMLARGIMREGDLTGAEPPSLSAVRPA